MSHPQPSDASGAADVTAARPEPAVFRAVPLTSLVAVAFVALGASTIAFQGHWWFTLLLVPLALAWVVVTTHTTVDTTGLRVQRPWGSRHVAWSQVSTLRLVERGRVRLVPVDGAETALPGIRVRDLGRVGEASGGRITVPTPAEAEAAAEHQRELAAARMRIERFRGREGAAPAAETTDVTAGGTDVTAGDSGGATGDTEDPASNTGGAAGNTDGEATATATTDGGASGAGPAEQGGPTASSSA